ncbi:MAG: hypothetical protein Tsb002_09210 [Wenzhouxiangellaceae bacterium]
MNFSEFIDNYLAHIIGVIALVQVWIIAAWKKWVVRPRLEFHPTANIEVGFSAFGPTVSLPGALRVINKNVFITEMRVNIVRASDQTTRSFTWRAFKSSKLSGPNLAPENIEFASSFTVAVNSPRVVNVFFASENFTDRYAQDALKLKSAWAAFVHYAQPKYGEQYHQLLQDPAFVNELFDTFLEAQTDNAFQSDLKDHFFWKSGEYSIELRTSSASLDDVIHQWTINLSEEDESRLRDNIGLTMKEICGLPVTYDFIYKPYRIRT